MADGSGSVGRRLQGLEFGEQALTLSRLAQARSPTGRFAPADVETLFDDIGLPRPARTSNVLAQLERSGLLTRIRGRGAVWKLTPEGRGQSQDLASDIDLAALIAETVTPATVLLGDTPHPVIPPSFAPPNLIGPLHAFLEEFPFEKNVFCMTRFPGKSDHGELDPIAPALEIAQQNVCEAWSRLSLGLGSPDRG